MVHNITHSGNSFNRRNRNIYSGWFAEGTGCALAQPSVVQNFPHKH